jgi:hypothetical protein
MTRTFVPGDYVRNCCAGRYGTVIDDPDIEQGVTAVIYDGASQTYYVATDMIDLISRGEDA